MVAEAREPDFIILIVLLKSDVTLFNKEILKVILMT